MTNDKTSGRFRIRRTHTPEEYRARLESHIRDYLELRATGLAPHDAAQATITKAFPDWHANRATQVASTFAMFAERYQRTMRRERDLVFLVLACISMTDDIAPPSHFNRAILSKLMIQILNEHWSDLDRPVYNNAGGTFRRIESFLRRLVTNTLKYFS